MRKKILLISTGGTIVSENLGEGLVPAIKAETLFSYAPEINKICRVDAIELMNIDSTNMRPAHWLLMADTIRKNYDKYDGFVITHGTDTMAYSSAALSYLLQRINKPVVLTGGQRSIAANNTDAARNLTDAFIYSCDDESSGVQIVFFGSVIIGTRARKNYAKSFMAFGSINYPEIARIQDGSIIRYIPSQKWDKPMFYEYLNPNVGLVKLTPGMSNNVMRYVIDQYDGLVVEGFGVGGLPEYSDFQKQIKEASEAGKIIVMTTQVPNEGSDFSVYRVGNTIKKESRVLEAFDMTSEAALAKLMWALGQSGEFEKVKELFYAEVYSDILTKTKV